MADSATLENATVGPTVHVMDGATLVDATVADAVIFPEIPLEETALERSIVGEGTRLTGYSLSEALLGSGFQVTNRSESPANESVLSWLCPVTMPRSWPTHCG